MQESGGLAAPVGARPQPRQQTNGPAATAAFLWGRHRNVLLPEKGGEEGSTVISGWPKSITL